MKYFRAGRGLHRWIQLCAIAALGIALCGCGGGSANAAAGAPAAQSSTAAQLSSPTQTATVTPTPPPAQSPPTAGGTSSASAGGQSTGSSLPTPSIGSITLHWLPPTENIDGTPLTDLAGYAIHYGTAPSQYTHTISVANPGIATYVVDNLTPGTYYFSVAAVNAKGTESPLSSEVSMRVD